ncbi:alpha/beta-hydrolase [Lactifluus volemus]|nr:alpha/beta-hydrolase [Lactifluus volemus]
MANDSEQPFQITIPDDVLALLNRKLEDTRFPDEVDESQWERGAPLADIKRLVERWKNGYDWRTHERELNKLPMFTRSIEVEGFGELNVHYVHQRSRVNGAIPLLFVHGWPGSFIEVTKVLPLLTGSSPEYPSFHVVAPSIPGYAWSQGVLKKGFHGKHYARYLFNKLMISLGYSEYVTQGGDWGHVLTLITASLYGPKNVKASHTNMPLKPLGYLKFLLTPYTSRDIQGITNTQNLFETGLGYFAEQTTKPQTLGYSLMDSPVGMLAWIYEKLVAWTDSYPWSDDEVLTWVSIYWFSRAGPAASVQIYYELQNPTRRSLLRAKAKVVFESEHDTGGHFAAYEEPEALVDDLRKMFGKSGPAASIVPGCPGY